MEIRFLENGLHSLKKGYDSLQTYEDVFYTNIGSMSKQERFYLLKDAILSIQHGVEILFKYVLSQTNELLIFSNLDKHFKSAYQEQKKKGLKSIFEVADKHPLHTISFSETIDRVDKLTTIELSAEFKKKLQKIESYRNQIMHSEVVTFETNVHSIFEGVIEELDMLLHKFLGDEYKTISGYGELVAQYKKSSKSINVYKTKMQAKIVKCFIDIFKDVGIGMGDNEVIRITDINIATKIFNGLFNSEFTFGADLTNGYNTGIIGHLKRIEGDRFSLFAIDNDGEYIFKFRSLVIYFPSLSEEKSPLLFIENDNDEIDDKLKEYIVDDEGIKSIDGVTFKEGGETTFDREVVEEAYRKESEEEEYLKFYSVDKFLSRGIFCFINIQQVEYTNASRILWTFGKYDGKRFEVVLKRLLTKEKNA